MFRNYLAAALRNFARNRLMAALNIAGLGVGLAAAALALLFIRHELSYDRFMPGSDRTHLLVSHIASTGQSALTIDQTPWMFAGWLAADFPDLQVSRLGAGLVAVRRGELEVLEPVAMGDPNLFSLLAMPAVAGDLATALEQPDSVVLTRRMARKYFGRDTPLGETLEMERQYPLQVRAVIEDLPANTHLTAEIFVSTRHPALGVAQMEAQPAILDDYWVQLNTYVAPLPGTPMQPTIDALQQAMPDFLRRHMRPFFDRNVGDLRIAVVALPDLHLYPTNQGSLKTHGSHAALTAVGAAALLIVLIAVINFINLMTARSSRRAVEVGVRKASGAARLHLMAQFLGEGLLYGALGALLALALVELLLPAIDGALVPGLAAAGTTAFILAPLLALALGVGLLGAAYPAFILSAFRPADVLKGGVLAASGSGTVRQGLVVLQFGLLIVLILAALVIERQSAYGQRDGLRVAHDQVLQVVARCGGTFLEEVRTLPGVAGVACAGPGSLGGDQSGDYAEAPGGTRLTLSLGPVGFDFFELFGIQPLAGRSFATAHGGDAPPPGAEPGIAPRDQSVILNATAARKLGFASPAAAIGGTVRFSGAGPLEIVGVVPDFTIDLTRPIQPTLYFIRLNQGANISIKLHGRDVPEVLEAVDALWKRVGEPRPIYRSFLDQGLQEIYAGTVRQGRLMGGLTAIAIFIAALGLFGLASFTAERRTKEIGIRKAMGAGVGEILRLLLWQFARPVLWANLIAWPAAFFVMRRWLSGFAYHIDLAPWMFLAAGGAALAIALATVAGHSLLVARTRPVMALRYE